MRQTGPIMQRGVATLATALILLLGLMSITFYTAKTGVTEQRIYANQYRAQEAFEAAEAGLEYGVAYLQDNRGLIAVDSDDDGYINTNTQAATLSNGATYTIVYSNAVPSNFDLLTTTSTGASADGTSTHNAQQTGNFNSVLETTFPVSVMSMGAISMGGNSSITNVEGMTTIRTGSTLTLDGSAATYTASGRSSTKHGLEDDVEELDAFLGSITAADLFSTYFGTSPEVVQGMADYSYAGSGNDVYDSQLAGKQGTMIWIEQSAGEARLVSNTVVGSAANPVLLIVNGDFRMGGGAVVYGQVYVVGNFTAAVGGATIMGGLATTGSIDGGGGADLTFNSAILDAVQSSMGSFSKVSGSWKDL